MRLQPTPETTPCALLLSIKRFSSLPQLLVVAYAQVWAGPFEALGGPQDQGFVNLGARVV